MVRMTTECNDALRICERQAAYWRQSRVDDEKKIPEMMLQIDHKDAQRRQNYRRAEAFLLWKFGSAGYDDVRRIPKGSGMDWPSLFVEFVEKVEEDLLARMRDYEKVHFD